MHIAITLHLTGERLAVYVNPYTAEVLGSLDDRGTVMRTARYLHSFKFFGQTPRKLIEIAAGWSILLVATGIYLWWPRNGRGRRGEPLLDMSYADYGPLGRWLEFGINVHLGQEFGLINQLFLLAVCIAIIVMCVAAGVMWWKRRPARQG